MSRIKPHRLGAFHLALWILVSLGAFAFATKDEQDKALGFKDKYLATLERVPKDLPGHFDKLHAILGLSRLGHPGQDVEEAMLRELAGPSGDAYTKEIAAVLFRFGPEELNKVDTLFQQKKIPEARRNIVASVFTELQLARKNWSKYANPSERFNALNALSRNQLVELGDVQIALRDSYAPVRSIGIAWARSFDLTAEDQEVLKSFIRDPDEHMRIAASLAVLRGYLARDEDPIQYLVWARRSSAEWNPPLLKWASENKIYRQDVIDALLPIVPDATGNHTQYKLLSYARTSPEKVFRGLIQAYREQPASANETLGSLFDTIGKEKWSGDPIAALEKCLNDPRLNARSQDLLLTTYLEHKKTLEPGMVVSAVRLLSLDEARFPGTVLTALYDRQVGVIQPLWKGLTGSDRKTAAGLEKYLVSCEPGNVVFRHGLSLPARADKLLAIQFMSNSLKLSEEDLQFLAKAHADPDPTVRKALVQLFVRIFTRLEPPELASSADRSSCEIPLAAALEDRDPSIQHAALTGLESRPPMGYDKIGAALWRLAKSPTGTSRERAWKILASASADTHYRWESNPDVKAANNLALNDPSPAIRQSAQMIRHNLWPQEERIAVEAAAKTARTFVGLLILGEIILCLGLLALSIWGFSRAFPPSRTNPAPAALLLACHGSRLTALAIFLHALFLLGTLCYELAGYSLQSAMLVPFLVIAILVLTGVLLLAWTTAAKNAARKEQIVLLVLSILLFIIFGFLTALEFAVAITTRDLYSFARLALDLLIVTGTCISAVNLIRSWRPGPRAFPLSPSPVKS